MPPLFDLIVHADVLMDMEGGRVDLQHDVHVCVRGGKIVEITEAAKSSRTRADATRWIDGKGKLLMPGLINGHTHLTMSMFRGAAEDLAFHDWIYKVILPIEGKLLNPELVAIGSELAMFECLSSGVTTVADMYYFEDIVADVADRVGMRGIFAEHVADFVAPDDRDSLGENYRIIERMVHRYRDHPRIKVGIGAHAPYSCSDATLTKVAEWSKKHDLKILIHVAETAREVEEHVAQYGKTPVQRLFDLGFMDRRPLFAHGVHLQPGDFELIQKTGTSVVYNPESNMKLGSGAAPIVEILRHGIALGIGTDGAASNNDLDLFREMDSGAKLQKLTCKDPTSVRARDLLRMATSEGARALGLENEIGSIEVGKRADLILLSLNRPELQPIYDLPSQLVYSGTGRLVDTVICEGRVLVEAGRVLSIDWDSLKVKIQAQAQRIKTFLQG